MSPIQLYGMEELLAQADSAEKKAALASALSVKLEAFQRSGVSWQEWCNWSDVERRAMYLAGARVDAYRAAQIGKASHDVKSMLAVLADFDEGEAHDDYVALEVLKNG